MQEPTASPSFLGPTNSEDDKDDTAVVAKAAALTASRNVPARVRRRKGNESISGMKLSRSSSSLKDYHELPDYLQDNEFIRSYYRGTMSLKETAWSIFTFHNETGNIWTHLIGFLLFLGLTIYITTAPPTPLAFGASQTEALWHSIRDNMQYLQSSLPKIPGMAMVHSLQDNLHSLQDSLQHNLHHLQDGLQDNLLTLQDGLHSLQDGLHSLQDGIQVRAKAIRENIVHHIQDDLGILADLVNRQLDQHMKQVLQWPTARWPMYAFLAGAMTCLFLSSFCHLFACCSKHVNLTIWRFDYAGIATLIVTSFYPPVYYGFLCETFWRRFYLITTSIMGLCTVCVSLLSVFQSVSFRPVRAGMFAGLGMWGLAPILHQWLLNRHVYYVQQALWLDLWMGIIYLLGALIYALRIPERWRPGKFDVWMHSHQLFHVAVVAAAFAHYKAVLLLLEWRDSSGGCAASLVPGPVGGMGHEMLGIDQVIEQIKMHAQQHLSGAITGR